MKCRLSKKVGIVIIPNLFHRLIFLQRQCQLGTMMNTTAAIHTLSPVDNRITVFLGNCNLWTITLTLTAIDAPIIMKIYRESCNLTQHFIWIIKLGVNIKQSENRVVCRIKANVYAIIVYPVKRTVQNLITLRIAVFISKISAVLAEIKGLKILSQSALNNSIYLSARLWLPFTDNPIYLLKSRWRRIKHLHCTVY